MLTNKAISLTKCTDAFLRPKNSNHRQYEALRAYFVEKLSTTEVARRFGYTAGSLRVLCHQFRRNPDRPFFLPTSKGPTVAPKRNKVRQRVVAMRKSNFSIYDIKKALADSNIGLSAVSISKILKEEGFARLPRRKDEERPVTTKPEKAPVADVRCLNLEPRSIHTKFGGLFLFIPYLAQISLDRMLSRAGFPGSAMIPAAHAMRSLLGLKLFGNARHSHVMSYVFDEGLALFAGLNAIPKRAFLTEYSCRIETQSYPLLMKQWFDAVGELGIQRGVSFDLDFHTIPFHGEDALMEKHYITKRSRRQKGILAFLARDAETNVFCYANGTVRKDDQNDEILRFVEFWKQRTGTLPRELVFDSRLTTYANIDKLNRMGIAFITLRRRSPKLLEHLFNMPYSRWKKIELENIARAYRTPPCSGTQGISGPL